MTEEMNVRVSRLITLGQEWAKNPNFKECCRKMWKPEFFEYCERKIKELERIAIIENRLATGETVQQLDISEINVEEWE